MSALETPATRSLAIVLRSLIDTGTPLRLVVATTGAALTLPEANAYVNVTIQGTTVKVPKLSGAPVVVGGPAYLLASDDFLLYLGTVKTT